ncbi:MAG: lysophospholipid acyltransferase family protein, partial [Myxococcaceae bacterium]
NHPNALVDPALVFCLTGRKVTFLAKAPLFKMPVIGWLLKGLDALPVYRKQDDPTQMTKNEGTLDAAADALVGNRAITIFPEGKSHSDPQLADLKTGAARIAFKAARRGADVKIVPVGLTYAEKHRFRSEVLIDLGEPISVRDYVPEDEKDDVERVRAMTDKISDNLKAVTLNLEEWSDLPLIRMAEELYAFKLGEKLDPDRLRRWAAGVQLFRREQPERFLKTRDELMQFRHRHELVRADPTDLTLIYRRANVYTFIVRNLFALLLGFPLFLCGVLLFFVPFQIPRTMVKRSNVEWDQQATMKLVAALVLTPIWTGLLTFLAWKFLGLGWAIFTVLSVMPFALFTRYFYERRRTAIRDALVFLVLGNRASLKARLLVEGEKLAGEVEALADEYRQRVVGEAGAA